MGCQLGDLFPSVVDVVDVGALGADGEPQDVRRPDLGGRHVDVAPLIDPGVQHFAPLVGAPQPKAHQPDNKTYLWRLNLRDHLKVSRILVADR